MKIKEFAKKLKPLREMTRRDDASLEIAEVIDNFKNYCQLQNIQYSTLESFWNHNNTQYTECFLLKLNVPDTEIKVRVNGDFQFDNNSVTFMKNTKSGIGSITYPAGYRDLYKFKGPKISILKRFLNQLNGWNGIYANIDEDFSYQDFLDLFRKILQNNLNWKVKTNNLYDTIIKLNYGQIILDAESFYGARTNLSGDKLMFLDENLIDFKALNIQLLPVTGPMPFDNEERLENIFEAMTSNLIKGTERFNREIPVLAIAKTVNKSFYEAVDKFLAERIKVDKVVIDL